MFTSKNNLEIRTLTPKSPLHMPVDRARLWYIVPQGARNMLAETARGERGRQKLEEQGFSIVSLVRLCSLVSESVIRYYKPDSGETRLTTASVRKRFESAFDCTFTVPTLVWMGEDGDAGAVTLFEFHGRIPERKFADRILSSLPQPRTWHSAPDDFPIGGCTDRSIRFSKTAPACPPREPPEDEVIESIIIALRWKNEAELARLGLDEAAIRFLAGGRRDTLSRLRITRSARIVLEDFGGREIKLEGKSKALYFLYLRHPEGLGIKDLADHRDELLDLYMSVSGRSDLQAMRQTIAVLCDPYGNDANVCMSRIKRAFVEAVSDSIAKAYYVDGVKGGVRKVSLDRAMVIWETVR